MSTAVAAEPVPLHLDADRVLRVGGTRVPLETVVELFQAGATPEDIAQDFPVLQLDDIYAVVTYFLRHREEVEGYLSRRRDEADRVQSKIEAVSPQNRLRERLLARRDAGKADALKR